jgi:hypothetical protein
MSEVRKISWGILATFGLSVTLTLMRGHFRVVAGPGRWSLLGKEVVTG